MSRTTQAKPSSSTHMMKVVAVCLMGMIVMAAHYHYNYYSEDADTSDAEAATMTAQSLFGRNGNLPKPVENGSYGIDVSFPIHGPVLSKSKNPLGDRQGMYLKHLQGCRKAFPQAAYACDHAEYTRKFMNQRQPVSVKNFTATGFKKIRAPQHIVDLVAEFWERNQNKGKVEVWPEGNSYVNTWDQPTLHVSVDDRGLRGSGYELKQQIWAAATATLEEWFEEELQPCSLYGIRVYQEGAIMLPHVDRLPLVASAMLNVAQDVDVDWPLELYDHSGKAHNITLHPGDMLLFESSTVVHGHPFPLEGRYYASIFIHFEPTGHPLVHNETGYHLDEEYAVDRSKGNKRDVDRQYRESVEKGYGGPSAIKSSVTLPPYLRRESPEEQYWLQYHPGGWQPPNPIVPPEAHAAAKAGKVEWLEQELEKSENKDQVLTERDENGFQVLHQGVMSGNVQIVELLVTHGADINSRTFGGYGETPLRIAEKRLGGEHPISAYIKSMGGLSIGPEL